MSGNTVWAILWLFAGTQPSLDSVAGEYYSGDGLGVNWTLTIEKSSAFHFTWDGCLGRYAELRGRAQIDGSLLQLSPDEAPEQELAARLPLRLAMVPWGSRMYLVAPDELAEFANAANLMWEPRKEPHGSFLLRARDWHKHVRGDPFLPQVAASLLLRRPVKGRVVRLLERGQAEINLGTKAGVLVGQELWVVAADRQVAIGKVLSVSEDRSVIDRDEDGVAYSPGQKVLGRRSP